MHPPPFCQTHPLSEWPDCTVEIACRCGRSAKAPVRLLRERHGDPTFAELVPRLRCQGCGAPPAPVYLVAGQHRNTHGGPPPDWSVLLVKPPV